MKSASAAALLFGISQGAAAHEKLLFMNWGGGQACRIRL
jgi:hypothetical protein